MTIGTGPFSAAAGNVRRKQTGFVPVTTGRPAPSRTMWTPLRHSGAFHVPRTYAATFGLLSVTTCAAVKTGGGAARTCRFITWTSFWIESVERIEMRAA